MVIAALLVILISLQYYFGLRHEMAYAREIAEIKLSNINVQIDNAVMDNIEWSVSHMEGIAMRHLDDPEYMYSITRNAVIRNSNIIGAAIAFEPDYFPSKGRWFEPYSVREGDSIVTRQLGGEMHDYLNMEWYQNTVQLASKEKTINDRSGIWSEPYFDADGGHVEMCTYAIPLINKEGKLIGVATADLSLDWLDSIMVDVMPYPHARCRLYSGTGRLMTGEDFAESDSEESQLKVMLPVSGVDWQLAITVPYRDLFGRMMLRSLQSLFMLFVFLLLLYFIVMNSIRSIRRLADVSQKKQLMDRDMQVAGDIQRTMLPMTFPAFPDHPEVDIYARLVSARAVGGDLYDFFMRDDKLFFCIGDVSGKGVSASLVMAVTHSLFRSVSTHEDDPAVIVSRINEAMQDMDSQNMFVTFFLGILNLKTGELNYCNAGHEPPILMSCKETKPLEVIPNLPIGVLKDVEFKGQQQMMSPGMSVFLYTDGLNEAEDEHQQLLGEEAVLEQAKAICLQSPEQQIESMSVLIGMHTGGAEQSDDYTLLSVRYNGFSS